MSTVNNGPQIVRSGLVLDLDASYMRSYSPNVFPNPIDPYAWAVNGGVYQMTLSRDATMTRQYGSIPLKIVTSGTSAYTITYNALAWNLAPAANGQTWTFSFWTKGNSNYVASALIFEANSSGTYLTYGHIFYNVTTSWTRVSGTYTFSNASAAYIQFRIDNYNNGVTQWVDGIQVERASTATTFNPYYIGDTVWRDISGNNNNGTINGATFNSANKGAIVFDGVDDYIDLNSNNIITGINPFTFEAFYKLSGAGNAELFGNYGSGYSTNYIWISGRYGLFINGGYPYFQGYPLSTGTYHMAVTRDSAGTCSLYKNGVLDGTATNTVSIPVGLNFRIGSDVNGLAELLNGEIYSMRVYNRTLSATEIFNNYQATKTRFGL